MQATLLNLTRTPCGKNRKWRNYVCLFPLFCAKLRSLHIISVAVRSFVCSSLPSLESFFPFLSLHPPIRHRRRFALRRRRNNVLPVICFIRFISSKSRQGCLSGFGWKVSFFKTMPILLVGPLRKLDWLRSIYDPSKHIWTYCLTNQSHMSKTYS